MLVDRWLSVLPLLFIGTFFPWIASSQASQLQIYTEDFPPFNYIEDGKLQGLVVDIVNECLRRQGKEKTAIMSLPWSRAYRYLEEKPSVMLFSTSRIASREQQFHWVGPVASYHMVFAIRSDFSGDNPKHEIPKGALIGSVLDSSAAEQLQSQGYYNIQLSSKSELNISKLLRGRIDYWLDADSTIHYRLQQNGVSPDQIKIIRPLYRGDLYLAFSQGTPTELIKQWRQSFAELKADGSLAKIQQRYQHYFLKADNI